MALITRLTNQTNGHADSYWRAGPVHVDPVARRATLVLEGYRDADWRQAGGAPNSRRDYAVGGDEYARLFDAPAAGMSVWDVMAAAIYEHVRRVDPDFADAANG